MGWENRPYYRESSGSSLPAPLHFLLYGSVPLFTAFGIRARAHASLLVVVVLFLLFGFGNEPWATRFEMIGILVALIILHEFGHCFAARWAGGDADEITLYPLGGLAMTMAPRRPLATFITVAGGPAVNLVVCLACAGALAAMGFYQSWNPWHPGLTFGSWIGSSAHIVTWWRFAPHLNLIFAISYLLLLFNMLPLYPMDGGQILHTILWPRFTWYHAMLVTCRVSMIGSVPLAVYGLMRLPNGLLVICIAVSCFANSFMQRRALQATGPYDYEDEVDYSQSLREPKPRRRRPISRRKIAKLRREAQREATEASRIDAVLAKVSERGMASLSYTERRALKKATERQRRRELDIEKQGL